MSTRSTPRLLSVFMCYSLADKATVREIYNKLKAESWIDPWLDEEKIDGGGNVNLENTKAVDASHAAVVFLSKSSIAEEGPVQKRLRLILNQSEEKLPDAIYVIPFRIEKCIPQGDINEKQFIDYFPKTQKRWAYDKLLQSLRKRAESLGIKTRKTSQKTPPAPMKPKILKVGFNKSKKISTDPKFKLKIIDPIGDSQSPPTPDGHYVYTYGDIQFVKVPAGPFIMGSKMQNPLAYKDENPQVPISIPYDYFIGRYPVTVSEYIERYIAWTGATYEGEHDKEDLVEIAGHPITCVPWEDARNFCKWLNDQYAKELPLISGVKLVFRLPTEPEWEKAARGENGWEWPWGNKFDKTKCNSLEGGVLTTTPVGAYSSKGGDSPFGAADMAGNVWEWTSTLFARYPYKTGDGRERNQRKGLECVVRGGCYRDPQKYVRTCYRYMIQNYSLYYFQGFRVVIAPPVSKII